jgi:hypothetical protein
MSNSESLFEMIRRDAQELQAKIASNINEAQAASWAQVKAAQADALALAARMKAAADDQAEVVKANVQVAVGKLEVAAKLVENKAVDARADVLAANTAMRDSAQKAAQSLGEAVDAMRTKAAAAIAPKKA